MKPMPNGGPTQATNWNGMPSVNVRDITLRRNIAVRWRRWVYVEKAEDFSVPLDAVETTGCLLRKVGIRWALPPKTPRIC